MATRIPDLPVGVRPHGTRRAHQQALRRAQRRRRRRRQARLRRIRRLRAMRSLRFWARAGVWIVILAVVAFWARLAVVYDIPPALQDGPLVRVRAYVTVKPWWFGPPAFDLGQILHAYGPGLTIPPRDTVEVALGRYRAVFTQPVIIWAWRSPP